MRHCASCQHPQKGHHNIHTRPHHSHPGNVALGSCGRTHCLQDPRPTNVEASLVPLFKALHGLAPGYLRELLHLNRRIRHVSFSPSRHSSVHDNVNIKVYISAELRSSMQLVLKEPRTRTVTYGDRAYSRRSRQGCGTAYLCHSEALAVLTHLKIRSRLSFLRLVFSF